MTDDQKSSLATAEGLAPQTRAWIGSRQMSVQVNMPSTYLDSTPEIMFQAITERDAGTIASRIPEADVARN